MDDVRVHRSSSEPAKLGALAYARGSEIHVGPGQERHLAHEAWHVVQQKQGRVAATRHLRRTALNDEPALEREADLMGARALAIGQGGGPEGAAGFSGGTEVAQDRGQVTQCATYTWRDGQWVSDGGASASDAPHPKAQGDFDGQTFDDTTGEYGGERGPAEAAATEQKAEEPPFGRYTSVSASSAHHDLKLIRQKAASAAQKAYGFSFVDKGTEAADVAAINAFMSHVLRGDPAAPPVPVAYGPATHEGSKAGMIQFTLRGRTYSTHDNSPQLFPVSGDGIESGKGSADMVRVLRRLKLLDLPTFYALREPKGPAWKQASKAVKARVQQEYEALR